MTTAVLPDDWYDILLTASDRAVTPGTGRARLGRKYARHMAPSLSIDAAYDECVESLREAFEEAARPNRDGYGGQPVPEATLAQALAFLDVLPSKIEKPDISPHADGEIGFEWSRGRCWVLTVSVNESGRLSYAALFGHARLHGTEFLLDALPEPIALALRRLSSGA